jgi:nucleoside-diphosphate-sugar epimerase
VNGFADEDLQGSQNTRYTILGANGFIGSRLLRKLTASSINCYAPALSDSNLFQRDLGRVFYCVGLTADYAYRPFDTVEAHVTFLAHFLTRAWFEKMVYLSSTRLYDGLQAEVCREDEDLLFNPSNPRHLYDLSKALGENLCMTASNGRASVARLSCVYDDTPGSTGFLSELLHRLRTEKEFTIASSSGVVRDYLSIGDVLIALKAILDSGRHDVYNVASGENVSNQEIADILNGLGCHITLSQYSERQNTPTCDVSKLKSFGLEPTLVRNYLKFFLMNLGELDGTC